MSKVESIFVGLIIGPVLPIVLFLAGWWISLSFVTDWTVFVFGLIGLGIGFIVDLIFLKQWISRAYMWQTKVLAGVYIFYSVGVFGFFMGVPIFNLAVGIMAGIFMGRRFYHSGTTKERLHTGVQKVSLFTASTMGVVSVASAYFATKDLRDTALNLRGMFKLSFLPTDQMIIVLIVVGGIGLVLGQYFSTKRLTHLSYRIGSHVS